MFKYLSVETKDFKYQISLELLLSKYKRNGEREFAHVSFNSTTKTVIGSKDSIDKSFEEIFNEIDKRISEESGWVNESDDSEYVNVSSHSPLSGSSSIELPHKLRSSEKALITIENDDNKCFLWCHRLIR